MSEYTYNGALAPYLDRIVGLHKKGKTPTEIARIINSEGCEWDTVDYLGNPCQSQASGTLVNYVLRREGMIKKATSTVVDRWSDILPDRVAKKQRRWEKTNIIRRAVKCGLTHQDIAAKFGISKWEVGILLSENLRNSDVSPVEEYFSEPPEVVGFMRPTDFRYPHEYWT